MPVAVAVAVAVAVVVVVAVAVTVTVAVAIVVAVLVKAQLTHKSSHPIITASAFIIAASITDPNINIDSYQPDKDAKS